jgi:hypothetical protein
MLSLFLIHSFILFLFLVLFQQTFSACSFFIYVVAGVAKLGGIIATEIGQWSLVIALRVCACLGGGGNAKTTVHCSPDAIYRPKEKSNNFLRGSFC